MSRIMRLLTSSKVFWIVCVFFVIEAIWIAVTGAFPMAFDEQFHLGIIKIYAHHVSPFLTHQPSNADEFGAVFRDPSYLYQYIMSFPYRLINLFIHTQTAQIIALRFINIALFISSLPIFRRLLVRSKLSPALINVLFMVFVLVPVVPLLAAQINYDNLFMPLVATALLLTVKLSDEIKAKDRLNAKLISGLFVVCLLASLVQYL